MVSSVMGEDLSYVVLKSPQRGLKRGLKRGPKRRLNH
jgi:hypothetical protein